MKPMRTRARFRALAGAVICAAGLAGCHHLDRIAGPHGLAPAPGPVVRQVPRPRSQLTRLAKPRVVPAGARIRSFCGQRHIRFQSGTLKETEAEKARNDVLCQQK